MIPRREPWIAIDLDQTFLFRNTSDQDSTICTWRDGEPSSRISNDCLLLLQTLAKEFTIVPLTSRGAKSFGKVVLEQVPIEIAGVNHGAQLLIRGRFDPSWQAQVSEAMVEWQEQLTEIENRLRADLCHEAHCRMVKIDGMGAVYFRAKFPSEILAEDVFSQLRESDHHAELEISVVNTQVHLTPAPVTRGTLVRYLSENVFGGRPPTMAFGDGMADLGMMRQARIGATPVGSSLWRRIDD